MKVYINDKYLDFEAPIHMSEEQREEFIHFMRTLFPSIEIHQIEEVSKEMGYINRQMLEWTVDDYYALLKSDSNEQLSTETGRSDMSILMKRGSFIPEFYSWLNLKGYSAPITKEMVSDYLTEKEYRR